MTSAVGGAITIHQAVLADEVVALLGPRDKTLPSLLLDCTLGGAGHTFRLLDEFPELRVVAIDLDPGTLARAELRLQPFTGRFSLFQWSFAELEQLIDQHGDEIARLLKLDSTGILRFDGILADLGYSSDQLEDPLRGLSFLKPGPLDMRLNPQAGLTAAQILNEYSPTDLRDVFRRGGVGPGSTILARAVIRRRPLDSTLVFAGLCEEIFPRYHSKSRSKDKHRSKSGPPKHPATVPFQALRIEVNDELNALQALLSKAESLLANGGRLGVISFHSTEDKLVTSEMRRWERVDAPRGLPLTDAQALGKLLTKKAVTPTEIELQNNPRSRSARFRVFEKH